jgi:hypothetical protein
VTLDGNRDSLTARVRPPPKAGRFLIAYVPPGDGAADLNFVSERVALSERDADVFEGLPLSLRLHLIDVVEEGRGEARLDDGGLTLLVNRAGLDRPDAADQAAIRLDVLSNLARAFAGDGPAL